MNVTTGQLIFLIIAGELAFVSLICACLAVCKRPYPTRRPSVDVPVPYVPADVAQARATVPPAHWELSPASCRCGECVRAVEVAELESALRLPAAERAS